MTYSGIILEFSYESKADIHLIVTSVIFTLTTQANLNSHGLSVT